ncbi:MAG: c-type cytochrome [Taibaiella sp.]|nr:c-type cytochrome [Taibaiella sp.]
MKKAIVVLSVICFIAASFCSDVAYHFRKPGGWPAPVYDFSKNPLSKEKILLGRALFHDPILSADSTISCTSCHLQYTAFTHVDHALSHGINGNIGTRNSPTLMNMAWGKLFMWDGAVNHLDMQPLAPIAHPAEMGSGLDTVLYKLRLSHRYRSLFYQAFADSTITGEHFLKAISQFMLTLISANSRYDKVMRHEPGITFTSQEKNGYKLFRKNCASCHREPLFTTNGFANNGLSVDTILHDFGRGIITHSSGDSQHFKIPTLRNIEFSYPYMHDGRFRKLQDVINHYTSGITEHNTLSKELKKGIKLSSNEKVDLIAFLLTLTDKDFLFDTSFSYPHHVFRQ